ncbi:MAG: peptidyl-prolyl cis-trans isomerase, partial [Lachnospiraceae bacterium]|nr:peptidyl-prolyl cis-trans isomerase [Lachnospiraceae bacterium]
MKKHFAKIGALAMVGAVLFTGCGDINPDAKLVTITHDDTTDSISLGYGNFAARYTQALYDTYYGTYLSDDMWSEDLYGNGNTMEEDTKNEVMDTLESEYVSKLHAADYGV